MVHHRKDMSRRRNLAVTCVAAVTVMAGSAAIVLPALATPGSGFTPTPLSKGAFGPLDVKANKTGHWDLLLKTKAASDIGVDRLTVVPGGQSGWHTHAGPAFITVITGEIVWYDGDDCSATTYRAGQGFVEPANHLHLVKNMTGATVEIIGIQARPAGSPGRIDAPQPNNCNVYG